MSRWIAVAVVVMFAVIASGCRCCRLSNPVYNCVDDCTDYKAELDRLYCAKLDISRAGMPDWCASRVNRAVCKCRCDGTSCCVCPVYYPTEYTTEYRLQQAEEAAAKAERKFSSEDIGSQLPAPEETPLPPEPKE